MISVDGDRGNDFDKVAQCTGFRGAVRLVGGRPDRCAGRGKVEAWGKMWLQLA